MTPNAFNPIGRQTMPPREEFKEGERFNLPDEAKIEAVFKASTKEWIVCLTTDKTSMVTHRSIHHAIMVLGRRWANRNLRKLKAKGVDDAPAKV